MKKALKFSCTVVGCVIVIKLTYYLLELIFLNNQG
jgi:hypothetical protein